MSITPITRQQYLAGTFTDKTLHARYYAQFVSAATTAHVVACIGGRAILASTNEHFNDIRLALWDEVASCMPRRIKFSDVGDRLSMAGLVCIAKCAARMWAEENAA